MREGETGSVGGEVLQSNKLCVETFLKLTFIAEIYWLINLFHTFIQQTLFDLLPCARHCQYNVERNKLPVVNWEDSVN